MERHEEARNFSCPKLTNNKHTDRSKADTEKKDYFKINQQKAKNYQKTKEQIHQNFFFGYSHHLIGLKKLTIQQNFGIYGALSQKHSIKNISTNPQRNTYFFFKIIIKKHQNHVRI